MYHGVISSDSEVCDFGFRLEVAAAVSTAGHGGVWLQKTPQRARGPSAGTGSRGRVGRPGLRERPLAASECVPGALWKKS